MAKAESFKTIELLCALERRYELVLFPATNTVIGRDCALTLASSGPRKINGMNASIKTTISYAINGINASTNDTISSINGIYTLVCGQSCDSLSSTNT